MRASLFSKLFLKTVWILLLFQTALHFSGQTLSAACSHHSSHEKGVLKDQIVDMSSSYPVPHEPAACHDVSPCRRAHQGLYNELVNCVDEKDDQVKITCNNIIYGFDSVTGEPLNSFWVYKKQIVLLDQLQSELIGLIPNEGYGQEPTIVLIFPWDQFSVGTRFKYLPEYDTQRAYAIERIDYITNRIIRDFVPHENAIEEVKQDQQYARKLFIKIINNLIDRVAESFQGHVIPYVWGGGSFVEPYIQSNYYKKDGSWHRQGKQNPYSGYDCSEFVMRMAKIAGIDFPWKTTKAIELSRKALDHQDQLEEGDLIWVPGHIMIVNNIVNSEVIESRAYSSGYGCVHRFSLNECFEGISDYNDLLERYYNGGKIRFKNSQGEVVGEEYIFKLLKLTV